MSTSSSIVLGSAIGAIFFLAAESVHAQEDCSFIFKNCTGESAGQVLVKAYNGNDSLHWSAASKSGILTSGQSATLACKHPYCDIRVSIDRPPGYPRVSIHHDDEPCGNLTLVRAGNQEDVTDFSVRAGLLSCSSR